MAGTTPPPLQGPTAKERRYDRQLRLWAANGQAALEEANILLINSGTGVVGIETLKNLVLPGIGEFTILDPAHVTEADLGLNFFLEWSDIGAYRAERCCRLLKELNPDVQGQSITENLETWIARDNALEPYSLILVVLPATPEILDTWKARHEGKLPQSYEEKSEFRAIVSQAARTNTAEGGEENFDEAVAAVLKNLNPPTASSGVREVFEAEECNNLTGESAAFWVIAQAIRKFYLAHGVLPVPGGLPDMKAKSADYIDLQTIYKSKAREDAAEVTKMVRALEAQLHKAGAIDQKEIEEFCKGAAHIKLVRGRPPLIARPAELPSFKDRAKFAANKIMDPDSLMPLYIAYLAYDSYVASHNFDSLTDPAGKLQESEEDYEAKVAKITSIATAIIDNLIKEAGTFVEGPEYSQAITECGNVAQELVRANGGEMHNIAALTGGMVAQEAIKVITKQYIPVNNTCLFDGIKSKTSVLRL